MPAFGAYSNWSLRHRAILRIVMTESQTSYREVGEIVALRYITTDGRIEMSWPCRVVVDSSDLLALFIAAGSPYRAGPKKSAIEKRKMQPSLLPPDEYVWRKDTLRLMFPSRRHSVSLLWDGTGGERRLDKYFVNMEEPFRRTAVGMDTQDHTLDINVTPDLRCSWRDEAELDEHVKCSFYTVALADAVRDEGASVIEAISKRTHPCLDGWGQWTPDPAWTIPDFPAAWATTPLTFWDRRRWAYGTPA